MATFNTIAAQTAPGVMTELYLFKDRAGNMAYYNSGQTAITYKGNVYQPATLKRDKIKDDDSMSSRTVTITAPITKMLTDYLGQNSLRTEVSIFRLFEADQTEVVPIFFGIISEGVQIDVDAKTVSAKCVSNSLILEKEIPALIYSAMCQNVLFDARCGLSAGFYTVLGSITAANGNVITSTDFSGYAANWFAGGYASFANETRMITKSDGNDITLLSPFNAALTVGSRVSVYAGCDGSPQTCRDKFNNLRPDGNAGFNGCPYIPSTNPVIWGV